MSFDFAFTSSSDKVELNDLLILSGDWSYPVVDASREHAKRRIRDEEDAILSGKFKSGKGKGRKGGDDQRRPLARHRPGSYGALAETNPGSSSAPSSRPKQQTSTSSTSTSRHPAPIGESIVQEAATLVRSAIPGLTVDEDEDPTAAKRKLRQKLHLPFGKKGEDHLPDDAVDLMVEDAEAEEEEMLRQRRRGEPTAKRTRVYRKAYTPPDEEGDSKNRGEGKGHAGDETVQAREVVEREESKDGPKDRGDHPSSTNLSPQKDQVERFVIKEDERFAKQHGIDETPGVDGSNDLNPWE